MSHDTEPEEVKLVSIVERGRPRKRIPSNTGMVPTSRKRSRPTVTICRKPI